MSQPTGSDGPIRILIAHGHPIVRDGLRGVLGTQPDFAVVGEVGAGAAAVERARRLAPEVVLLDLEMPGLDGVAVLRRLRACCPGARAIVFTALDADDRIVEAMRAGARGYLLKGVSPEELFTAIRVVHAGGSLLQPVIASRLPPSVTEPAPTVRLSPRELAVLRLLARGASNKLIAAELSISERTVKFHVSAVIRKLGAGNRTEALSLAARQGLIDLT